MPKTAPAGRHTLSLVVDNEAGVMARIIDLLLARGYHIESLAVAEVSANHAVSRITIVASGLPETIEQTIAQIDRLAPVHRVIDLTTLGPHVEREMALVKVISHGDRRQAAERFADLYSARIIDATIASLTFEVTGSTEKVDMFIALLREIGQIEVARTGIVAIARGREAL